MWYVRDVLYAVLYVRVSCFVVRGCYGTLCGYGGCCDCNACTVVCVACV